MRNRKIVDTQAIKSQKHSFSNPKLIDAVRTPMVAAQISNTNFTTENDTSPYNLKAKDTSIGGRLGTKEAKTTTYTLGSRDNFASNPTHQSQEISLLQ